MFVPSTRIFWVLIVRFHFSFYSAATLTNELLLMAQAHLILAVHCTAYCLAACMHERLYKPLVRYCKRIPTERFNNTRRNTQGSTLHGTINYRDLSDSLQASNKYKAKTKKRKSWQVGSLLNSDYTGSRKDSIGMCFRRFTKDYRFRSGQGRMLRHSLRKIEGSVVPFLLKKERTSRDSGSMKRRVPCSRR